MGFGAASGADSYEQMRDKILDESKRVFKPEFFNRLDDMIVFHTLNREDLVRIVDLEVAKVVDRVKAKEIKIQVDPTAVEFLIDKGYDPTYGARPMRRAVEKYLEDPFAEELLRSNIKIGDTMWCMPRETSSPFEQFSLNRVKSPMPHRQLSFRRSLSKGAGI